MEYSQLKVVGGATDQSAGLSPAQKTFNNLIRKIELERTALSDWQAAITTFHATYTSEYDPLLHTLDRLRIDLVRLMDKTSSAKELTRTQREKLSEIICTIASGLVDQYEDDAELKAIYLKHGGTEHHADDKVEIIKTLVQNMFGVEIDDRFDPSSPEEFLSQLDQTLRQHDAAIEPPKKPAKRTSSKSTKAASAAETRRQEEERNISQSLREVYRKLVSALHPDKELDGAERTRKTALMQRVNVAYDKKDLLQLLELQLELEQIDAAMVSALSEDRLKYYNKILREQLNELRMEVTEVQATLLMRFDLDTLPGPKLTPEFVLRKLRRDIKEVKDDIEEMKADLVDFQDVKYVKRWLNAYRGNVRTFRFDDQFW